MPSLGDAEQQTATALEPELRRHGDLTLRAFDAIGRVLEAATLQGGDSRLVTTILLTRLANDLRGAALLALRGYPLQAATLVAAMFEAAYTIAFIGGDDILARQWRSHADPTASFRPIRQLVDAVLAGLPISDVEREEAVKRTYRDYRQLCLAKHVNPLLQRQHGLKSEGAKVAVIVGPNSEPDTVRVAWFALDQAAALAFLAAATFLQHHTSNDRRHDAGTAIKEIEADRRELSRLAIERGWGEDPFPGQW